MLKKPEDPLKRADLQTYYFSLYLIKETKIIISAFSVVDVVIIVKLCCFVHVINYLSPLINSYIMDQILKFG